MGVEAKVVAKSNELKEQKTKLEKACADFEEAQKNDSAAASGRSAAIRHSATGLDVVMRPAKNPTFFCPQYFNTTMVINHTSAIQNINMAALHTPSI